MALQQQVVSEEERRLEEDCLDRRPWKKWGPYLSERQWGTVREDYSPHGTARDYVSHDHARSCAYRWGEDGLAGFSDDEQRLCLALALWNGSATGTSAQNAKHSQPSPQNGSPMLRWLPHAWV